tara:strand:+ start:2437 stop:3636 length:1200 start_codon:yes stop_codon:yes gene_type:complete
MIKKLLFPIIALILFITVYWELTKAGKKPEANEIERKIPSVEIFRAKKVSIPSTIFGFGTVSPSTFTTLIAEVPGIVEDVAPFSHLSDDITSFRSGGFFKKDDLLLKIEDTKLITIEAEARANLRRNELLLMQEHELAKQAKIEWGERDWNLASKLVKRIPQIQKAEAETNAAIARLDQATRDLNRSLVCAPFEGRILKTMVDIGQQVGSGAPTALAEIYALDSAEIDISLSQSEMKFLGFLDGFKASKSVAVEIMNSFGDVIHVGKLDRSEGIVDPRTRLTKVVAKIDKCFANPFSKEPIKNPLAIGQFVKLKLTGIKTDVFIIPESAFRTNDTLLVIENKNKLVTRKVNVINRAEKKAWVSSGIKSGDQICVTPIEIISEGMTVNIVNQKIDSNQSQ